MLKNKIEDMNTEESEFDHFFLLCYTSFGYVIGIILQSGFQMFSVFFLPILIILDSFHESGCNNTQNY